MKQTLVAWLIFLGGLTIEIGIDYILRIQNDDMRTGGIPEPIWFIVQISLAIIALYLAYIATKSFNSFSKRILALAVQGLVGFLIYVFIILYYVTSTGIDAL